MSGQPGYSLGIYKAGPEVLLLGHWLGHRGRTRVTGAAAGQDCKLQAVGRRRGGGGWGRQNRRRCDEGLQR